MAGGVPGTPSAVSCRYGSQSPAEWIGKALEYVAALPAKTPGKK
jgi:hypothetical protein